MAKPSSRLRRRRRIRAGIVLALASTTSAVSLNDLQPVLDGLLPVSCSLVYNTAIQGCTTADFARGETCSLSCIAGIRQIENNIDDPCQAVNNNALTLLNDALRGSLIVKLCVGNDFTLATTTSTSSSIRQTSTLLTNPLVTTSQTVGSFSTIPFPTTTSLMTTIPAQTTISQSTATQSTLSFVPPPNTSTSALTTTQLVSSTTSQTPVAESTLSSTSSGATSTSTSSSQSGDGRGGGSPFDTTSQSSRLSLSWSVCLAAGALIATLRLP